MKKIILSLMMAVIIIAIPNVSASASIPELPELPKEVNNYKYYLISDFGGDTYLNANDVPFIAIASDRLQTSDGSKVNGLKCILSSDGLSWTSCTTSVSISATKGYETILYNNYDILDTSGEIVFVKKLVPIPDVPLHQIIQGIPMGEAMTVVVSLVGSVVSLIVLSVGFRKSWSWLRNLLQFS